MLDSLEPIAKFSDQIQREVNIEAGVTSSVLSSVSVGSTGNISERSMNNSSFLDMTQTVSNDLKDLICPNLYCVMRDYALPEDLQEFGRRKGAKKILEQVFTKQSGATNDVLRRNKVMECLKTLFPHRTAFTIAKPESFSDG